MKGPGPRSRAWAPALLAIVAVLAVLAGPVEAERTEKNGLIVFLNGGITPRRLPRAHLAPVAVKMDAGIRTEHRPLPRVRQIRLELAWRGTLDTEGLMVCPEGWLKSVDTRHAMAACGPALVGKGSIFARVFVPNQAPFGLHAELTAFNGRTKYGRPALWVLAYAANPPDSIVIPFHVKRQPGRFRTVLVGFVPRSAGPWPHFAHFHIVVSRLFNYRGRRHSYMSASCPLPPHFTAGFLSLARVTFTLEDAPQLRAETVRSCRAR